MFHGRKPVARLTPNQARRRNVAFVEALAGRAIPELREGVPVAPKPRARGPVEETEAPVLKAVGELLAAHPQVLFAVRQNSGALPYQNAAGKVVPVWFFKIVTKQSVRITDYWGFLRSGKPFALECKRPSWQRPHSERELEQAAFLMLMRNLGGVGAFVRSADEAMAALIN